MSGLFHGFALACDVQLRAKRDEPLFRTLNDGGEFHLELWPHVVTLIEPIRFFKCRPKKIDFSGERGRDGLAIERVVILPALEKKC